MPESICMAGAIISLARVDFKCPACEYPYEEKDYFTRLNNSKHGFIYKTCKGCKEKIGIAIDMQGDVAVWLKKEEKLKKV